MRAMLTFEVNGGHDWYCLLWVWKIDTSYLSFAIYYVVESVLGIICLGFSHSLNNGIGWEGQAYQCPAIRAQCRTSGPLVFFRRSFVAILFRNNHGSIGFHYPAAQCSCFFCPPVNLPPLGWSTSKFIYLRVFDSILTTTLINSRNAKEIMRDHKIE